MGRRKGTPVYAHKSDGPNTYITTEKAAKKRDAAVERTNKSASDVITHALLNVADSITTKTPGFEPEAVDDQKPKRKKR